MRRKDAAQPGTPGVLLLAVAAALLAPAAGQAQGPADEALSRGGLELSTAVAVSLTQESGDEDWATLVNVPLRLGFVVARGLEVEGEALLSHASYGGRDGSTGVIGALHLLYHFRTGGSTVPYVLVGGGYGNGAEFLGVASDLDEGVVVLRAGAGFKTFLSPRVSLRGEYRFTHYDAGTSGGGDYIREESVNDHKVLLGFSVWF